jgi:protein gp37
LHNKRHKAYVAGKLHNVPQYSTPFEEVRFWPERLKQLQSWREPRMVFVGSMCDVFHEDVKQDWMERLFATFQVVNRRRGNASCSPNHIYVVLTKRPERMRAFVDYWYAFRRRHFGLDEMLPNLWLGTTVCNQAEADEKIPILLQIPAAKRFVSIEPLLSPVDLWPTLQPSMIHGMDVPALDWIIVGGESGPNARECAPGWIRGIVEQCQEASVPVFVKQMGREWSRWMELPDNPDGWRRGGFQDLCVREWPEANQ